ncbi:hypothetical protein MYU51_005893 [Penicillium brevicompactum]|uniref:uncharacterized protein n=1 Tax=Penicillium brevicompactum TaxID=5074 RepID=UPI002540C5BA|nr:uncharacterized protein N7506_004785 [Penicillium brevicompactum]KAJ5336763.1 hypothetical protein N7506_004785 [Penicillium brevicompactum]
MASKAIPVDTKFTVFIRLPFPRGDFEDPQPVEWNASKDQALWDVLSRPSKGDIDWKALAGHFDVTLQFLLQQAAWLYDRQLSQVRAQMRKVGTTQSTSPSPVPGSVSGSTALGGQPSRETIIPGPRAPSRQVSQQQDTPQRAFEPRPTSVASTAPANQTRGPRPPSRTEIPTADSESRWDSFGRRQSTVRREQVPASTTSRSPAFEDEPLSSSMSEESESDEEDTRRGPRFKRFGKASVHRSGLRDDEDDDEDDTPAFLPLIRESQHSHQQRTGQELSATLRLDAERATQRRRGPDPRATHRVPVSESSTSSMSSAGPVGLPPGETRRTGNRAPISGPQRALGPRQNSRRSNASGRETSDGTPSMGSSFSDLDGMSRTPDYDGFILIDSPDASVTQSALEEALLSNMQHGGMASRMSTISQALRSRYLQ